MRHALILAGGGGTRLWPASRRARPKQLLALGTRPGESLLAATARRLAPLVPADALHIVTAADQAAAVWEAVPHIPGQNVLAEPVARNTAAAIGLAAVMIHARDKDATIGAVPADQLATDEPAFKAAATRAYEVAEETGAIVTIGLKPTRPETGFGYLELGAEVVPGARAVARFVEKPDVKTAQGYVTGGKHLWNGGMFFFRAAKFVEEMQRHMPETAEALGKVATAMTSGGPHAAAQALATEYPKVKSVSVDYGIMEKTSGILTVPGDFGWNDVGSWTALADVRPADAAGNVADGELVAHEAKDNIISTDDGVIALVGVSGLCVVRSGNAVLVLPRERAQDVREIVKKLEAAGRGEYL